MGQHSLPFGTGIMFALRRAALAQEEDKIRRELQLTEDLSFQRREWTAQRAGWAVMALVLLAALAGVFGFGPVSNSSAERDGLRLEYERFARLQQTTSLRFHFSGDGQDTAAVSLSRKYLASVQIEQISPEPQKVEADVDWLIYFFFVRQRAGGATFHLKPEKFGRMSGEARLGRGEPISFGQFIYP